MEQVIVLLLIGILWPFWFAPAPCIGAAHNGAIRIGKFRASLRASEVLGNIAPTTRDVTALAGTAGAVCVFKFNKVVVKDFSVIGSFANLATSHALSPYWIPLFYPIDDIEVMNVLLCNVISTNPCEVIPISHLIF